MHPRRLIRARREACKSVESYESYSHKVLKLVHSDTGVSKKGMSITNSFINDIFGHIADEAGKLATLIIKENFRKPADSCWQENSQISSHLK